MTTTADDLRRSLLSAAFRMPSVQTMVSRKSSITNAFVSAIVPVIPPSLDQIEAALKILGMEPDNVRCVYCGDSSTEWDHLRPLVLERRPTGYISEIANLVPACGKCNQSKGNKQWRHWITSKARLSPSGRGLPGLDERITRLELYEKWRTPIHVDFVAILGTAEWDKYWKLCDDVITELRECQKVAETIRTRVFETVIRVRQQKS
jgi:hypothetical protein